jgi:hypothetical protein
MSEHPVTSATPVSRRVLVVRRKKTAIAIVSADVREFLAYNKEEVFYGTFGVGSFFATGYAIMHLFDTTDFGLKVAAAVVGALMAGIVGIVCGNILLYLNDVLRDYVRSVVARRDE